MQCAAWCRPCSRQPRVLLSVCSRSLHVTAVRRLCKQRNADAVHTPGGAFFVSWQYILSCAVRHLFLRAFSAVCAWCSVRAVRSSGKDDGLAEAFSQQNCAAVRSSTPAGPAAHRTRARLREVPRNPPAADEVRDERRIDGRLRRDASETREARRRRRRAVSLGCGAVPRNSRCGRSYFTRPISIGSIHGTSACGSSTESGRRSSKSRSTRRSWHPRFCFVFSPTRRSPRARTPANESGSSSPRSGPIACGSGPSRIV